MKNFVACPKCCYKLCAGKEGSDVTLICPKCKEEVEVIITEQSVKVVRTAKLTLLRKAN